MPLTIGERLFKSQTEATTHVRGLLHKVGCCESVKNSDSTVFKELVELIKRHPDGQDKTWGVVDFKVQHDLLNKKAYMLVLVRSTGEEESISWRCCISGKGYSSHQELMRAMRHSISEQIIAFRNSISRFWCEECDKATSEPHIDHIIHFAKLVKDFHKENTLPIPSLFEKAIDGRTFRIEDIDYATAWKKYHKETATLRMLCKSCNLSRENYIETP